MYDLAAIAAAPVTAVGTILTAVSRTRGATTWLGLDAAQSATLYQSTDADRDLYSVARCVSSEAPAAPAAVLATAEAIWSEAGAAKLSAWALLTGRTAASYAWTQGAYGEGHGRFASTRRTPTARSLLAARMAREGSTIARGARRWFAPRINDSGHQGSRTLKDAITIAQTWAADGWQWVGPVEGVDSYVTCFLAKVPRADPTAMIAMIKAGRAGAVQVGPTPGAPPSSAGATVAGAAVAELAIGAAVAAHLVT